MSQTATENGHIAELRKLLPVGSTVFTILRNVSRSGMSRVIEPVIIRNNEPTGIPHMEEIGFKWNRNHDGYTMGGCGMDMGFALVYELSGKLYPDGFECIGERCPSNDHTNARPGSPAPKHHRSGGYALRQRWL